MNPTLSESIPDGFEEQIVIPQDHLPLVINAKPLFQVAPTSESVCSTSSEDLNKIQSESAPQLELIFDPSVLEVTSISVTEPSPSELQLPTLRWTRSHPIYQILGNPHSGIKT